MGIDEERFVEPIDDAYKCSICLGVFLDPVQDTAGHIVCRECIIKWLKEHNNCPMCRRPLKLSDLKPSYIKIAQLSVLKVRCEFMKEGCPRILEYASLSDHTQFCEFNPNKLITCPYGCNVLIEKTKIVEHKCYSNFEIFIKMLLFIMIIWVLWTPMCYLLSHDIFCKLKLMANWTIAHLKGLDYYYLMKFICGLFERIFSVIRPFISTIFNFFLYVSQFTILAIVSLILFSLSFMISAFFLVVIVGLSFCFVLAICAYVVLKF